MIASERALKKICNISGSKDVIQEKQEEAALMLVDGTR
jgi:hypothetical protein